MDNKIIEETDIGYPVSDNSTLCDDDISELAAAEESADAILNSICTNERDLKVMSHKRVELDSIQRDLDDLMSKLNSFIADAQEKDTDDEAIGDGVPVEDEVMSVSEKQDGPPEKELRSNSFATGESLLDKIYTTDGSYPPEINWDAVGPILQKHVSDLQRLRNLNQMTSAMLKRIRNVTQPIEGTHQ